VLRSRNSTGMVAPRGILQIDAPKASRLRRMPDLDGIRGILALCVVLLHFGVNSFLQRALGYEPANFPAWIVAWDFFLPLS
jgi:peptidoglycan/LPS O-acetylase OafA/YrhL